MWHAPGTYYSACCGLAKLKFARYSGFGVEWPPVMSKFGGVVCEHPTVSEKVCYELDSNIALPPSCLCAPRRAE